MKQILFYKTNDPQGFLNNFYPSRIYVYNRWWKNVEAPYQSRKTIDKEEIDAIWAAEKPKQARDLGQKVKIVAYWDEMKDMVMYDCVLAKFTQNHDLLKKLLETGDAELIEDSPVDWYWGWGKDHTGQNKLGQILMEVREELQGYNG